MSIASNLQAQLTSQLIAALGTGTSVATREAAVAAAAVFAELKSGQTIAALVTANAQNGRLPLLLNGIPVLADLKTASLPPEALKPGAQLLLKVETTGAEPRLIFQSVSSQNLAQRTPALTTLQQPTASLQSNQSQYSVINIIAKPVVLLPQPTPPQSTPLQQAVAHAVSEAASRQGSAAPLYADLAAILAKPDSGLPQSILKIATTLLNNRLDGDKPISPKQVAQAVETSGIFQETLERKLDAQPLDTKALLNALKVALQSGESYSRQYLVADQEPPSRDAPITAHKSVASTLKDETDSQKITSTLSRETEQAVERIKLHQIASLPERNVTQETPFNRQFNFEIPIAIGQQTAMAGFRIEQEKKRNPKPGEPTDIWGIRFAIDADLLGPVHAHLRLSGLKISVSLWAEDPATHRFFVQSMPLLEAALAESALEIGELIAFPGKPAEHRRASAGHFLDKRS